MGVVALLTGLMFPALTAVRENARRVYCSSNLHQIGLGMSIFYDENPNKGRLPASHFGTPESMGGQLSPQNMMALHRGLGDPGKWEGIGHLYAGRYCGAAECFYCPSHHGEHPFEAYQADLENPGAAMIFSNYHYAGHLTWNAEKVRVRRLEAGYDTVLVTDGLRTASDFNHGNGFNLLRADLAVEWKGDFFREIFNQLPLAPGMPAATATPLYSLLWNEIENPADVTPSDE